MTYSVFDRRARRKKVVRTALVILHMSFCPCLQRCVKSWELPPLIQMSFTTMIWLCLSFFSQQRLRCWCICLQDISTSIITMINSFCLFIQKWLPRRHSYLYVYLDVNHHNDKLFCHFIQQWLRGRRSCLDDIWMSFSASQWRRGRRSIRWISITPKTTNENGQEN